MVPMVPKGQLGDIGEWRVGVVAIQLPELSLLERNSKDPTKILEDPLRIFFPSPR